MHLCWQLFWMQELASLAKRHHELCTFSGLDKTILQMVLGPLAQCIPFRMITLALELEQWDMFCKRPRSRSSDLWRCCSWLTVIMWLLMLKPMLHHFDFGNQNWGLMQLQAVLSLLKSAWILYTGLERTACVIVVLNASVTSVWFWLLGTRCLVNGKWCLCAQTSPLVCACLFLNDASGV